MKIGIFSDIHGNLQAFEVIYRELKKEKCDMHLFLGDICGYYFRQNETIEMVKELPNMHAVSGNHDAMFLMSLGSRDLSNLYATGFGLSFTILKERITPSGLDFLKKLPLKYLLEEEGIAAFHGSPWSYTDEYIYPDSAMDRFDTLPFDVVFLGHTHRPMDIRREGIHIINPGSVGQPRDGGLPSYATYDTNTGKAKIKRIEFDVDACIEDVKVHGDTNRYITDVLKRIKLNENL
jgi:putative phosphoesterase